MRAAASTEALKTLMTRALPVILAVKVTKEADLGAILLSAAPNCLKYNLRYYLILLKRKWLDQI